jgi:methylamine--corrinoid protein Co-methyltransferase
MIPFLDVYERSVKGPMMSEDEFNMKHFNLALKDVVNAYGIKYERENSVPNDDKAVDNLFHTAVDFLSRVGVHCLDTNRVVQFTKEEIYQTARESKGEVYLGVGIDAGILSLRKPEDPKPPWLDMDGYWPCSSEATIASYMEKLASIPETNGLKMPALKKFKGRPITAGAPIEMYATIEVVNIARNATSRAG